MPASPHLTVEIDLNAIRQNARRIGLEAGVPLLAVVKADAYGLGAAKVVRAIRDLVAGFCVFSLAEAVAADIWNATARPTLALGPDATSPVEDYLAQHVRPGVWEPGRALALRRARPVLSVDTGMQRFGTPADQIDAVLAAGECDEAYTHATSLDRVRRLVEVAGNRGLTLHAAGSSLLHEPEARLDAVRPGLALYQGAVRVVTPLVETRRSTGPVGYGGFSAAYHGVILAGYFSGLRPGPCLINGRPSSIREVGMQSAYVETTADDAPGDEVVLLGDSIAASDVARAWRCSAHEALTHLAAAGRREYRG